MSNVKESLKMILEGTFMEDITSKVYKHQLQCEGTLDEISLGGAGIEKVKAHIAELEKLIAHNERLKDEVRTKTWRFENPDAEIEKLNKQHDKLQHWLDLTRDDAAI